MRHSITLKERDTQCNNINDTLSITMKKLTLAIHIIMANVAVKPNVAECRDANSNIFCQFNPTNTQKS